MLSYVWGVLYPVVLLVRGHPRLVQLSTNSCILQVPPGADRSGHWLDFAVGAHYLDGDDSVTPQLEALLAKFPDWTVPIGWSASYQHHQL